jgi:hypothetical protein
MIVNASWKSWMPTTVITGGPDGKPLRHAQGINGVLPPGPPPPLPIVETFLPALPATQRWVITGLNLNGSANAVVFLDTPSATSLTGPLAWRTGNGVTMDEIRGIFRGLPGGGISLLQFFYGPVFVSCTYYHEEADAGVTPP